MTKLFKSIAGLTMLGALCCVGYFSLQNSSTENLFLQSTTSSELDLAFTNFISRFKKNYKTVNELALRKREFERSWNIIK